jgi:hypothetical protein
MSAASHRQILETMKRSRRIALSFAVIVFVGCREEAPGPPAISTEVRQLIKQNLTQLGAKITAEEPEGLYASLRNTHVELLESGGVVEGYPRNRQDFQDFALINEAIAKGFLASDEFNAFQQWLRHALSPASPGAERVEYARYEASVSRAPLRIVFSQRAPAQR